MNDSTEYWSTTSKAVSSKRGVVAAQHAKAAQAGASILTAGGNAVDAAVATAFALGVVEPWMSGLGGSGYMVVWQADQQRARALDFQGVLPRAICADDYPLDAHGADNIMGFPGVAQRHNETGYGSVAVPGALAGLVHALQRYGSMELGEVMRPAIALADAGLPVNWFTTLQIALAMRDLQQDSAAQHMFLPNGVPPQPGTTLPLTALAASLRKIAENGAQEIYSGQLGAGIREDLQRGGSCITAADFADYQVIDSESPEGCHRGVSLHTAGLTSGGPRLLEALEIIQQRLAPQQKPDASSWKVYIDAINSAWRSHRQLNATPTARGETGGCTSHLSVVDRHGSMVALTCTLLDRFGSCVLLPQSGILMNNAVSYFDPRPGYPTSIAGGKRINSSNMSPTIATLDGESLFSIGASGANYIMPCTVQIVALMLDFGLTLEQALNHPRIDASDRQSVRVDPRLGGEVLQQLAGDGELELAQSLVFPKLYACPSGVSRNPSDGKLYGICDPSQPIAAAAIA